jgi:uncharacterized membrane protein (UPF0127 family)
MVAGRWLVAVAVVASVLAGCSGDSSSRSPAATSESSGVAGSVGTTASSQGVQPEGFTTVTARITEVDGEVCEVCVWLADNAEERGRGLMGVTDLGDAVGMVFRFDEPLVGSFYMFQTPTPLSIAWFAPGGDHVGSADMAPCLDTPAGECPLYSPGLEYDLALEVFEGGLDDLGVGPGARLELLDGTEAERCPLNTAASSPVSSPVSPATP